MKSYICNSCGAEILLNDNASFTTCLYCGNKVIISNKELNQLNIKKIIPFEIDKEDAIKKYGKLIKGKIVDAHKIYIPVRFCEFDFDFLLYYQHVVESDNSRSFYDNEVLVDGSAENQIIFNTTKIKDILVSEELKKEESVDYDPVLLKDVSVEYSLFMSDDEVKKQLEENVLKYSTKQIKDDICRVYSVSYSINDLKADDYSTLIPVYVLKTNKGIIYNAPGINPKNTIDKEQDEKIKKRIYNVLGILAIFVVPFIFIFLILFLYHIARYFSMEEYVPHVVMSIFLLIAIISMIISGKTKKKSEKGNYESTIYKFGNHRKDLE